MTSINQLGKFAKRRRRILWPLVALFFIVLFSWANCSVYVRPWQLGVKQVVLGPGQGVHSDIFAPGMHFLIPGVERLHLFPADLQILEMSDAQVPSAHIPNLRTVPAIKIQTSEGYTVSVDVTLLYRVEDAYKVMTQIGPGRLYEDSVVIPRSEQQLRRTFGTLDAEDFYRGDTREKTAEAALKKLSSELLPRGIAVTHVLVRQYRYDSRYQAAIEQRKIQDQTVFKNQAEAQAAQAEAEKNRIVAVGAASVQVEHARGDAEVKKLKSGAELYKRKKVAEGALIVQLAKAKGIELKNRALRGQGSENMVGLRMAKVLKGLSVVVLPSDGTSGTNPLDLNQLLRRFDVKGQ